MIRADVVVIGGGPAGHATAALLARRGQSVTLLERGSEARFRVGETLGAEVAAHLRALGADPVLTLLEGEAPFTEVRSAWGGPELAERASIQHPLGHGWHVQRARFDGALADWARSHGVAVHNEAGTCRVIREGGGFIAKSATGLEVWAEHFIDASGRGAPASTGLEGRTWLSLDRQVALLGRCTGPIRDDGLLLESVEAGYWYSAPLVDGTLIAVMLTDGDVLTAAGRDPDDRFRRLLATSVHTAARLRDCTLVEPLTAFRADNGRLFAPRGPGWCAAGDAVMSTDPLGGNGVARALRGALEAVQDTPSAEVEARAARRFAEHMQLRTEYHWMERRWPDAPFWARRRPLDPAGEPVDWRQVPLTLAPDVGLIARRAPPPAAEAWLPRAALRLLDRLTTPTPAHVALAAVRAVAPLGDRRLLVALQWLVATGVLGVA